MRASAILILAGLLLVLAAPSASAQAPASERHYTITPYEMLEVYGDYRLSNGEHLRITREHNRYWAEMPGTGKVQIVPVDSIVFVSTDGTLRLEFMPLAFATDVKISYGSGSGMAGMEGRSVQRTGVDKTGE